jgi:SEC-C motif-containing protein
MAKELIACPCGGSRYASCCGRYHAGKRAPDAESLMRSRYSAYALKLECYLLDTWHTSTRPALLELTADPAKWLGLKVSRHLITDADHATVEFVARYKIGGRAYRLHEISQFIREAGVWFYVDGKFPGTDS